ncbi:MAG: AAA family ATPase [Lentisphaeria bacterium]|nr:AAA family ATPase [Lentisphaeria bacterium]
MLRRLVVENYALIEHLEIEFDSSLNIITGETGAGKSILMGALALLLGAKNDSTTIKDNSRSCVVEGEFDIARLGLEEAFKELDIEYDHETIIRRTISPSGKSRAFVNDQPVQLSDLKQLGAYLIDIHSQHQNLILSSPKLPKKKSVSFPMRKPSCWNGNTPDFPAFTRKTGRSPYSKPQVPAG